MFKVIVSPRAWDDFAEAPIKGTRQFEIFDYISRDNRDAAARFCDALLNHVDLLGTFPHIGVVSAQRPNVRSVLHTPVRIYYRIDDFRECVEIIHFWHTARGELGDISQGAIRRCRAASA